MRFQSAQAAPIADLEPPVMDIFKLKEKIERVGKWSGYIIARANGQVPCCKPENVLAKKETIMKCGGYR